MLTKMQIAEDLESEGLGGKRQIANILDGLAALAAEEIAQGEDFTIPGIARVAWSYTTPLAKGEKYKKGDTYVGFGGLEQVAEQDSKARKASVKLKASIAAPIKKLGPTKDTAARFMQSKAAKAVVRRKG